MTATPILYDPDCGFCRVCVAVILRWDRARRLRPVALRSSEANDLLRGMPETEQMASWHLAEPGCEENVPENDPFLYHPEIRSGGAGFSVLFRLLPGAGPLARLTDRFPGAADRAYRWVADRRGPFGRAVPASVRRWADRVISESAADSR
jgi:predicted DCC family thiol-disulfide oxidoreductase YuxK